MEEDGAEMYHKGGFRIGMEKIAPDGIVCGATYSQRGGMIGTNYNIGYTDVRLIYNYLTGYVLAPFSSKKTKMDILIGGEIGYWFNGQVKYDCSPSCDSENEDIDSKDWEDAENSFIDYGFVFGGKYPLNSQMALIGTYYLGLRKINSFSLLENSPAVRGMIQKVNHLVKIETSVS